MAETESAIDNFIAKYREGPERIYVNHCWKCRALIDSRECEEDPGHGYVCNQCGVSLRTWPGGYLHKRL